MTLQPNINKDKTTKKKLPAHAQNKEKKVKKPKKITASYLRNSGLYYLEKYPASVSHFKMVMSRKIKRSCQAHPDQNYQACLELLDALIDDLIDLGHLNDAFYTRGMVTSLRRRGLSARAIQAKLKAKGLESADIQNEIARFDSQEPNENGYKPELIAALKLARRKKLGPYARSDKEEDKNKSLGVFARAGYSYEIANKVLELDRSEIEDF
jgi:regulatory protein